ncbi:LytTR family DNA-binding domain-containing protein [Niveispirillum cyanobacteriorum]|uniref:LytTR family DNA-binding domain-containing protein n=1 Tax=Niveispirillum cyanobacteriorum TaxID=1612173 RepID=UPI001319E237|nr:LytTR family DNA-binding domain-containing protein [Niveispirillum cyanobacteriorum]
MSSSSSSSEKQETGAGPRLWPWRAQAGKAAGTDGTGPDTGVTNGMMAVTSGGTSGESAGLGGFRPYLVLVPLTLLFALVNTMSAWDDRDGWPVWLPILTEFSSAVSILCLCWIPAWALSRAPLTPPWGWVLLLHLPAALLFSLLHSAGMALLRNGAGVLFDLDYRFDLSPPVLVYEGRKDVMTYLLVCGIFLLFGHGRGHKAQPPIPAPETSMPISTPPSAAHFDIRDGARLLRVDVADILAVRSAGNYAEFLLADGRQPLMRATLTQLTEELSTHGLLRTHRSWLVNRAHVRGLEPEGSGDYAITLSDGSKAPLSRRFPDALESVRKGKFSG